MHTDCACELLQDVTDDWTAGMLPYTSALEILRELLSLILGVHVYAHIPIPYMHANLDAEVIAI